MIGEKFIGVFDRGYDDNKIFKYMSNNKHEFVVRLDDERILLFKGKKSSVGEVAKTRKGKYIVKHKTSKKKMKVKRKEFKMWMKENMHKPVYEIMETIKRKLIGHYNYYGINNNSKSICNYYLYVKWTAYRILNRRHQKRSMSYEIFNRIWKGMKMPTPLIKVNIG